METLYHKSCPDWTVLIGDGSPINTLFYLEPEVRKSPEIQELIKTHLQKPDLIVFHTREVPTDYLPDDSNRVHGLEDIRKLEDLVIPEVLSELQALVPEFAPVKLQGSRGQRSNLAVLTLMERLNADTSR